MKEKAVRLGKTATLAGILTDAPTPTAGAPAVIMLNPGILHRVGACRFHVHAARALAAAGATVLRLDYSGIGDSDSRKDSLSFEEAAVLETREAMDYLTETRGARQFVLLGLCSGADMAHLVARSEPRVVGLAMLDAWAYRTPKYYIKRVAPKLVDPAAWAHSIKVRLPGYKRTSGPAMVIDSEEVKAEVPRYIRVIPPRDQIETDLQDFVARGIRMWFAFSASADFNYREQYRDAFSSVPFGDRLQVEYLPDANHIFTGLTHQAALISSATAWYTAAGWATQGERVAVPA
ncbi:MAG: alpha/beta hydrolase [Gemmatimonadaceae bacterium]|nr:alpha/beta hydrolase [Gemmatimonadaceae bacterium]